MALAPPAADRKRVKVYELKSNDWFDRGTGFCTGQVLNEEARIHVLSEDEPARILLETKISKDDGYQKQQDTLIVWTEANVTDMALSFQEPEGCAAIWDFVNEAQQRLGGGAGLVDDGLSDELMDPAQVFSLPPPDLGNLVEVEATLRMANSTAAGRDALAKFVVSAEYITKLVPLVEMAEDLESLEDLHRLCNIMKTMILLNDTAIIEYAVTDDIVLGVVGALEYDPDFPSHKANHRQYLSDNSRFKEVVKIEDPHIRRKIHYTYRLQYLKDVVLARILDDPTFSVLNSLIFFNQVDIVQHVQGNGAFLKELFGIFTPSEPDPERRKDAVIFIQQCCAIAKGLQANARQMLYQNFIGSGLFNVITFALKHPDASVRVAGTDVLMALIDHDTLMMRGQVFKAINEHQKPLTDVLIELLLVEEDLGVKSQMADAVKILLDPHANTASLDVISRSNSEFLAKIRNQTSPQADTFASELYKESARKLFKPISDLESREDITTLTHQEVSLFTHLIDMLCYFVRSHSQRTKFLLVQDNLTVPIAKLLSCPEKHLKLVALKFFRTCIGLHDPFYNEKLVRSGAFAPILDIVFETMPRDNLLNSACLELFEFIKRENMKELTVHLVEKYRERLEKITYVDTFRQLIEKCERYFQPPPEHAEGLSFTSVETEATPNRGMVAGGHAWRGSGLKEDAQEEAYFNAPDEEDDGPFGSILKPVTNGVGTKLVKPLVDYPDDDEDDMDALAQDASPDLPRETTETKGASQVLSISSPPELKRRREDDDEDELSKIVAQSTKRRSSSVSSVGSNKDVVTAPPVVHTHGHSLRRKKSHSLSGGKESPGAVKKISIALAAGVKNGGGGSEGE